MSLKINIVPIVRSHFKTLRSERSGRLSAVEVALHYALPFAVGVGAYFLGFRPNEFGSFIEAQAILFGFFFALAVFVFQLRLQIVARADFQLDLRVPQLIDELFTNSAYAVLLSAVATIVSVAVDAFDFGAIGTVLVVAFSVHILLLVMMCLKRINAAYGHLTRAKRQHFSSH